MKLKSLDRGLEALEALARTSNSIGVTEMAAILKTDKSTAYRILSTLHQREFVSQREDKRYQLGFKLLSLGSVAQEQFELPSKARPFLAELTERTGETSHLAQLIENKPIYVYRILSPNPVSVSSHIGKEAIGHATASGKVLIAFLPEDEMRRQIYGKSLEKLTANTITDPEELETNFEKIRKDHYSFDNEERYIGVRCIAAPVYNINGRVIASIGFSGPTHRMNFANSQANLNSVKELGLRLSRELGYTGQY